MRHSKSSLNTKRGCKSLYNTCVFVEANTRFLYYWWKIFRYVGYMNLKEFEEYSKEKVRQTKPEVWSTLFCSVLPGPKTRKPPGFCQKKPRLAGRFSTSNFSRPVSRPSDKCPFLILFLSNLCYFMTSNVWYYDHLLISLQKLDRKVKHRFSKNWNLLKSR